jgi:hypothetical protein
VQTGGLFGWGTTQANTQKSETAWFVGGTAGHLVFLERQNRERDETVSVGRTETTKGLIFNHG